MITINKINSRKKSTSSYININSDQLDLKRKSFDIIVHKRESFNKPYDDLRKKFKKKQSLKNLHRNRLSINYDDNMKKTKSKNQKISFIDNEILNTNLMKTDIKSEFHPLDKNNINHNDINNKKFIRQSSRESDIINQKKVKDSLLNPNVGLLHTDIEKPLFNRNLSNLQSSDDDGNTSLIHKS